MAHVSRRGQSPPVTEQYLARAQSFIESKDHRKAILALQKARDACKCQADVQDGDLKFHSSTKSCLLESIFKAAVSEGWDAIYKAAAGPCPCGTRKLTCNREAHVEALDKLALCSLALGKPNNAMSFAAAAIDLCPASPWGYCRLAQVLRQTKNTERELMADVSNNDLVLGVVKQGLYNVQNYGSVQHRLYPVLLKIRRQVVRSDPFACLPVELKVMVCSHLSTLDLIRCMKVSRGWLKAIRDDPELWKRIYLPLPQCPGSNSSRVKGLMRLLNRARRTSSLAFSEITLSDEQYKRILTALPELRHLHIEDVDDDDNCRYSWHDPGWGIQTSLTRLTFHVFTRTTEDGPLPLFKRISDTCKDTLEELQFFDFVTDPELLVLPMLLPKLRILRLHSNDAVLRMDNIIRSMPSLEQICLGGMAIVDWSRLNNSPEDYPPNPWPNLKVFVLGYTIRCRGRFLQYLPKGIRVIDILALPEYATLSDWFDSDFIQNAPDWPVLEYFRFKHIPVPSGAWRVLQPSIASGTLKTLYLCDEGLHILSCLGCEGQPPEQVQVLGLSPSDGLSPVDLMKCLDYYPSVHTVSISPESGTPVHPGVFKALVNRPGMKRIFQNVLYGVDWDEIQRLAEERGVIVHTADWPAYFPWRLDHKTTPGDQDEQHDVVDRWKHNRGRVAPLINSVVSQPFFQE
ncbi:hypothetical protein DL546_002056 [Coniochaeta pulveracea]|uniref:F-box domain-containing protein n=1 Tax=Coniochaeta pulveracea TaxID=177199 RepID=A0A420Y8Z6_9PEZI|nr:hypothetical protein DL546_002056 [Coniochaeta pulveracea]